MISIEHIHPILVHFPIVFFLTLAGLDIIAVFRGAPITGRTFIGNISAGLAVLSGLSAIAAMMMGDVALDFAHASGFSNVNGDIHDFLGTTTGSLFAAWAVIRAFLWFKEITVKGAMTWLILLAETGGAALVVTTAYYGGVLVYDLGVNVAH